MRSGTAQLETQKPRPFSRALLVLFGVAVMLLATAGISSADDPFGSVATLNATSHDFGSVDLGNTGTFVFVLLHPTADPNDTLKITNITLQQGPNQGFDYGASVGDTIMAGTVIVVHFSPT